MAESKWKWADLSGEQLEMLHEGEETLGAEVLLAYQEDMSSGFMGQDLSMSGLQAAPLNESQLECLRGLEKNMQAVVVAYMYIPVG